MVCTCLRWDRVTARLIAAVEQSGLLDHADLDELAHTLLSREHVIAYPLAWVSPELLEIELDDGHGRTQMVSEDTLAHHRDAVIHSLLDAAHVLDEPQQRTLVARGLAGGQSGVRLAALDLLCELDGPDAARRRARNDPNATVRKWTSPIEPAQATLL